MASKTREELDEEFQTRSVKQIDELNEWVERSELDRVLVEKEKSLVNVLEEAKQLECEKFKKQFVDCMYDKGSREECKHEFLLYAMCRMKKETAEQNT